nr:immunoglobulin light chain junction region [Macaca mulatta]
CQHYHTLPFTF